MKLVWFDVFTFSTLERWLKERGARINNASVNMDCVWCVTIAMDGRGFHGQGRNLDSALRAAMRSVDQQLGHVPVPEVS